MALLINLEGLMNRNRLAITFILTIFVVTSFIPVNESWSESTAISGSMQALQWVYILDTDENNYAGINGSLNFEDKKFQNFSAFLSWPLNPAKTPLYFIQILRGFEPQFLAVNFGRSPRPPPSKSL
jgi:hypothetical protein